MIPKWLYVVIALETVGFAMSMINLNMYVRSLGGTRYYLGALGSVCGLIALIWNPIGGSISDRIGRKPVLVSCIAICCIANFVVAATSNLWIVFITRAITSLGSQIMTMTKALLDDHSGSDEEKNAAMSKFPAFMGCAFLVGSILTGLLSENSEGPRIVFYVVSALGLINFGVVYLLIEDNKKVLDNEKKDDSKKKEKLCLTGELKAIGKNLTQLDWQKFWDIFTIKQIMDITVIIFHFSLGLTLTDTFALKGKSIGFAMMYFSIVAIGASLTVHKLKTLVYPDDKSGTKRLLHGSILLVGAFTALATLGHISMYLYFLTMLPQMMGRVLLESTCTELMLVRASAHEKGIVMGAFESTMALGSLVAPMMSGVVSGMWGESMAILLAAALSSVNIAIVLSQRRKDHQS